MKPELLPFVTLVITFIALQLTYTMWKPIAKGGWLSGNLQRARWAALILLAPILLASQKWGWRVGWILSLLTMVGLIVYAIVSCAKWKRLHPETLPEEAL